MKKGCAGLFLMFFALMVILFVGCGETTSTDSSSSGTKSMLLTAFTDREAGVSTQSFLSCYGCSNSDITNIGTVRLTDPNGNRYDLGKITGFITGTHYYLGNSTTDLGEIRDPLSETAQRQFGSGALMVSAPLNGKYKATMGDKSKEFNFTQVEYLGALSENDVSTQAGGSNLNASGDTITIKNQNNAGYRYFCVIYNSFDGSQTFDVIWSSADLRKIDWVDTDKTANFLVNETVAPVGGTVSFVIPGGILRVDNDTRVVIFAVNTSAVNSDTTGDIRTLVDARSVLRLTYNVR